MPSPVQRLQALGSLIELGMRTIKSGAMAGQIARWGRHLPAPAPPTPESHTLRNAAIAGVGIAGAGALYAK